MDRRPETEDRGWEKGLRSDVGPARSIPRRMIEAEEREVKDKRMSSVRMGGHVV